MNPGGIGSSIKVSICWDEKAPLSTEGTPCKGHTACEPIQTIPASPTVRPSDPSVCGRREPSDSCGVSPASSPSGIV